MIIIMITLIIIITMTTMIIIVVVKYGNGKARAMTTVRLVIVIMVHRWMFAPVFPDRASRWSRIHWSTKPESLQVTAFLYFNVEITSIAIVADSYRRLWQTTLIRRIIHVGRRAFWVPKQGLQSTLCCWIAGQRLAQKECFVQTPVCRHWNAHPQLFAESYLVNWLCSGLGPISLLSLWISEGSTQA